LPPMHELAKLAGLELPDYLGKVADQTDSVAADEEVAEDGEETEGLES